MKIVSAKEATQRFPDGGLSRFVELVFYADGVMIRKSAKISQVSKMVASDDKAKKAEAGYLLVKAVREAQRDAAFLKYGDQWRAYVGPMWKPATEEEKELISTALDILVK